MLQVNQLVIHTKTHHDTMTHSSSRLTLLLPGLFGPMPNLHSSGVRLMVPEIDRSLTRADRCSMPGCDYHATLFGLFGLPQTSETDLPEGAVNYLGDGGTVGEFCYLRADPVHLRPDRDRLLLFDSAPLVIRPEEAEMIAAQFNRHFAAEQMQLLTPRPDRWYLRLDRCPRLQTRGLYDVIGHHIEPYMPTGEDARTWRQLSNEMQMLLFQSPVNERRDADGRLTINGIWLSGNGRLPALAAAAYSSIYAAEPAACGLAQLTGVVTAEVPQPGEFDWPAGEENLLVLTDLFAPVLHADPHAWSEALHLIEQWLAGLVLQLRGGKERKLMLCPCNGEGYTLSSTTMRRLWRRNKPLLGKMLQSSGGE